MNNISLNKYEIDFLTESFSLSLGDFKDLLVVDFDLNENNAILESIKSLKKFYKLGWIRFEVWLYVKKDNKIDIVFNKGDSGFKLIVDELFWERINKDLTIWERLSMKNQDRNWDIGVCLTDLFKNKYLEPDDTEFYKLINQE